MNRIATAAISPIPVLFSSILHAQVSLASRTCKLRVLLGILLSIPLIGIAKADEDHVTVEYGHPGEWRDHDWSDSSSNESSSRAPSSSRSKAFHPVRPPAVIACQALAEKAVAAERKQEWKSAMRFWQEIGRIMPEPPGTNTNRAYITMDLGHIAEDQGDWNSAVRYYQEAIRLWPWGSQDIEKSHNRAQDWKESLARAQTALAQQTRNGRAKGSADDLDNLKAGSDLRERDVHGFHFVKSKQLPPPPILKGELPSDPVKRAAVKGKLDDYMKNWKERNQEYQRAAPKEAKEIKDKMEADNKAFKATMKKSYSVDL